MVKAPFPLTTAAHSVFDTDTRFGLWQTSHHIYAITGPLENEAERGAPLSKHKTYTVYQEGPSFSWFLLVTVSASKERKKGKRAAEEGFEIQIGPAKLTRFEKARIIGARSLQLAMGAPAFVPIDESMPDSISLAMTELAGDALPISVRRSLPNAKFQDIPVKYLL